MADEPITRLVLVRHGEAQAHLDGVVAGPKGCTGLSDLGRRQATALRDRLASTGELTGATVLYASILPRAVETAEIIAPALGSLDIQQDCELCELHPGECDGITWSEYDARYRVTPWYGDRVMSPGGESWVDFMARTARALTALVERHPGETVVVACHGGVIIGSMVCGLGLDGADDRGLHPENTSLTEWTCSRDRWRLRRFNDAAHLTGL